MSFPDICNGKETEVAYAKDNKPHLASTVVQEKEYYTSANDESTPPNCDVTQRFDEKGAQDIVVGVPDRSIMASEQSFSANINGFDPTSAFSGISARLSRQFWSAGDYEVRQAHGLAYQDGQNRLCVHPKFLHSNATSHKWAFGAIAELLDNAVDEIQNGAAFVIIDKIANPRNGNPALLIQDDGGGMDPESLRRCMSFGFSDKQPCSSIGQYGNGFKTSTMRLGADVIVFTRSKHEMELTQSVGLLSYTFLRRTGCNDIVVPLVDYRFDPSSDVFKRLFRHGQKQFSSNLSMLLKWSPFATEDELLKHFNDMGNHGTKIIVYNLWFNDEGKMELDFESDTEDIMISGAPKPVQTNSISKMLTQNHIANRLHFSLRAYSTILYLHLPKFFKIILRGRVIEHHRIASDLRYCECIKYMPQVGGRTEAEVITTIGFLEGAPEVNVHGFNIYHRNRLILPFCQVVNSTGSKGRGIAGVLEANFIKPTHDKQSFEKSTLYQKLESRLREMTYEYWECHCHLVGYTKNFSCIARAPNAALHPLPPSGCSVGPVVVNPRAPQVPRHNPSILSATVQVVTGLCAASCSTQGEYMHNCSASSATGLIEKRRGEIIAGFERSKRQALSCEKEAGIVKKFRRQNKFGNDVGQRRAQILAMMQENKKIHAEWVFAL
ncbi:protein MICRORCHIDIA 6-like isoform X2 [Phoenix dactylifera]|uniref:Protein MICRORCHIDIA 6-like isoform X2 n=1 Tax=Phoenix dactylifera TaxID=42345 RepID=A0A8B8JAW9_PHODC|nr:protein MICRORCHIDIA 6-like isoform X2 [Phoenix dactylifera]